MMHDDLIGLFRSTMPAVDYCSMRLLERNSQGLTMRQNIVEPPQNQYVRGVQITVFNQGGSGYAATCNLSRSGLKQAIDSAVEWADASIGRNHGHQWVEQNSVKAQSYRSNCERHWNTQTIAEKLRLLEVINGALKIHENIVDWWVALYHQETTQVFVTADAEIRQHFHGLMPYLGAVASAGCETQKRTFGSEASAQAGLEYIDGAGLTEKASLIAEQALQLLEAPNCASGSTDLLLLPDQMILQVHESIGHPLELDRILGDERNYAGSSFVKPEMFGTYQYGSNLLNVVFDPEQSGEIASYRFDDQGEAGEKAYLIRQGILQRPIGGYSSQQRAGLPGVAASRASSWNRAPIDRMANINVEPGTSRFEEMLASIENGVMMATNRSWSIDDCRNKFQFGCEIGWVVKDGEIKNMVKNPNYRGISGTFWRSLKAVGNRQSFEVLSVPTCGKGEPNQAIQVGHAAPACLFENVDVFGSGG